MSQINIHFLHEIIALKLESREIYVNRQTKAHTIYGKTDIHTAIDSHHSRLKGNQQDTQAEKKKTYTCIQTDQTHKLNPLNEVIE